MKRLSFFLTGVILLFTLTASTQQVVINEFMSLNTTTLQDADGDFSDWIELYNTGDEAINLKYFMITDDTLVRDKWKFPEMTLHSKSFLIIFASDKDRHDTTELHTNFKIKNEGEFLLLSDSNGVKSDLMPPVALAADQSYGRFPDGGDNLLILAAPTAGTANNAGTSVFFTKPAGFYTGPFKIALLTSNPEDTIFYTLDGSIPSTSSLIYTDSIPIIYRDTMPDNISLIPTTPAIMIDNFRKWYPPNGPVPKANVVRAASYLNGAFVSPVFTATYFVDTAIFINTKYPIVTISTDSSAFYDFNTGIYIPGVFLDTLEPDWTGNYFQKGEDWERPAYLEYFDENGNRFLNQDVGLRIHGNITRHAPQKTMRVYAKNVNGDSYFNYPLMINSGQDKFKRFLIRTSYADGTQTIFKDAMTHNLVKHLNLDLMNYRPVEVYINGEYWGVQTLRDRIDKYYLALKYNIPPDSIDLLENNAGIEEGSNADYLDMLSYIQNNDLSNQEHYDYIKTRMDIENFIDYQIVEIYFNNDDWPGNNIGYWRQQTPGAKWRWTLFDLDNCYQNYSFNTLQFVTFEGDTSYQNPTWATFLFRNLLKSEEFKDQFINRFAHLLNTTFQPDSILNEINYFTQVYEKDLERHIARWQFPRSHEGWLSDINFTLKTFVNQRPCYMRDFILDYFDLEENQFGFQCNVNPQVLPCSITQNLTLTNANGPFFVNCNIVVQPGVVLKIEKGVEIIFSDTLSIVVFGQMLAEGTPDEPITFKPADYLAGWGKIAFYNSFAPCLLKNVNLINGSLSAFNADASLERVYIFNDRPLDISDELFNAKGGNFEVKKSTFIGNNTIQGVIFKNANTAIVEDCYFKDIPDAVEFQNIAGGLVKNNTIINPLDDGIDMNHSSDAIITGNRIFNASDNGLTFDSCQNIILEKNLIVGCSRGINLKNDSYATCINNTLYGNKFSVLLSQDSVGSGGGHLSILNTILSNSYQQVIKSDEFSSYNVSYSLCDNLELQGENNIFGVPLFVSAADTNFQLLPTSPCINTGSPESVPDPDGTRADIGAFYYNFGAHNVIFNEINYKSGPTFNTGDWVEIYNIEQIRTDISGWIFKDDDNAHNFEIPYGTILQPGGYLILCENLSQFKQLYPQIENAIGDFPFGLGANGEFIRLYNHTGQLIDSVFYGIQSPWPPEPNGNGPTLELKNPFLDNALAESWAASQNNGTPGAINSKYTINVEEVAGTESSLTVFPNPSNGEIRLVFTSQNTADALISVFDKLGNPAFKPFREMLSQGVNIIRINELLVPGFYLIHVSLNDGRQNLTQKFIKLPR